MNTPKELYAAVQTWRAWIKDEFAWPGEADCILYAITEASELLDALLRLLRQNDVRAREKDTLQDEVGDTLMMLFSIKGMDETLDGASAVYGAYNPNTDNVITIIKSIINGYINPRSRSYHLLLAIERLYLICDNPADRVLYRLQRITEGRTSKSWSELYKKLHL
jgi:hypothetical protein